MQILYHSLNEECLRKLKIYFLVTFCWKFKIINKVLFVFIDSTYKGELLLTEFLVNESTACQNVATILNKTL